MKLTKDQINQLYTFTRQHYVEHFDLQTELVDHLANDIEQIWQENATLSFEEARDTSFKKFGVFGFMDVVSERTSALNKKYWKLVWVLFKEFFRIPQLISTVLLFSSIYFSISTFTNSPYVLVTLGIGILLVIFLQLVKLHRVKKQRFKQTNKKWILEEHILNAGNVGSFAYVFFQIPRLIDTPFESQTVVILTSLFFTIFILFMYCILFVLPSQIEKFLIKQYPEYKMV